MKKYEHKRDFCIKYCDADFKNELKISSALALMEEVACSSADELGFGYAYIAPKGYAFMLTNLHCRFSRPVRLGETICVKTWPTPPTHVIFGREYQFFSQEKELCLDATSRWCLVDMSTGKLLQSKVIDNQDYSTYNTTKLFEGVQWKLPVFSIEEGELRFSITIANSEYDHNLHVNNTRYADYCLNCFSVAELKDLRLKEFDISYVKQCHEGETLRFYRKLLTGKEYAILGVNDENACVIRAKVSFEE